MTATLTRDLAAARRDLDQFGYCLVQDALSVDEVAHYKAALQAAAGSSGGVMNLIGRAPAFLFVVGENDGRAFLLKALGGCLADAAGRTNDDCDFSVQSSGHASL